MCINFEKHVVSQLNQTRNRDLLHRSINNICNGGLHGDGECTAFDCSVKSKTRSAKYAHMIVFNGLKMLKTNRRRLCTEL